MHIKVFVFIILLVSGCSTATFSQTKTLLHSFQRHTEVKDQYPTDCWGPRYIKGWKEDYLINLYSDSTFRIEYIYSGDKRSYHDNKSNEAAKGTFYSINDSIYLIKCDGEQLYENNNESSCLNKLFYTGHPLRIAYTNDSLLIYYVEQAPLVFEKTNILEQYKKSRQTDATTSFFSPQLSNKTNSF